ncbi:MAG: AEC family transporter, partial [Actinomycetota bacterium]|nr:AEC family transporter [Actinomycetota bacterium]
PEALAPGWAVDGSQLLVFAIVPVGFFAVGVTLAEVGARALPRMDASILAALGSKLVVAPLVVVALSAGLVPVSEPFLAQPAMASAVNALVIANEYGLDRGLAAGAIAWSTAIVLVVGVVATLL